MAAWLLFKNVLSIKKENYVYDIKGKRKKQRVYQFVSSLSVLSVCQFIFRFFNNLLYGSTKYESTNS